MLIPSVVIIVVVVVISIAVVVLVVRVHVATGIYRAVQLHNVRASVGGLKLSLGCVGTASSVIITSAPSSATAAAPVVIPSTAVSPSAASAASVTATALVIIGHWRSNIIYPAWQSQVK